MIHRLAAAAAALALLLTMAAPVLAGGWAEIVADPGTEPPVAGEPIELGFTVLQHGRTPAPWETPTVHLRNVGTGATLDVVATNDRSDGHFVATVSLPDAGYWTWQVTLTDLVTEQPFQALAVRTASGALPAFDAGATLGAIDRTRREVVDSLYVEVGRLDEALSRERARTDRLAGDVQALTADRDALAAAVATTDEPGGVPLLALVTLALLAGAAAGGSAAWLVGRPRARLMFDPAPREADPA